MAIALSNSSDENNVAGTSSQISSEIEKGASSEMLGGCTVCSDDQGTEENPLVYCDGTGCEVAVHKACYGIVKIPPGEWKCRKCESSDNGQIKIKCELCPSLDGALKPTKTGLWAHVVCALYIPEVTFGNSDTMEPIEIDHIQADRYNKSCYLCAESGNSTDAAYGAVINCHKLGCKQSFHVTCAQTAGLLFEQTKNQAQRNSQKSLKDLEYLGYCEHHFRKLKAGNRKSTAKSLTNNTSSSYLDSASDSSQDNDSRCNTTEPDKNSIERNNKLSTMPSNLSTSDPPKPSTPSPPPHIRITTATTTAATTNSHPTIQTSVSPSKTSDSKLNSNNNSLISLTLPVKATNKAKKNPSESATSSPQKKKRAPRKAQGTSSSTNSTINTSTLLTTTCSQNNILSAQQTTANCPSTTHVNNSQTDSNVSGDIRSNNLTIMPSNSFVNDPSPSMSTISTTTTTTANSHSPVQTSVTPTKSAESKPNKNSPISLTVPIKSKSRSKKKTQESEVGSPPKKKRAPRKKAQGEPGIVNASSSSSTLMTTIPGSFTNSFSAQPLTAPFPNSYPELDVRASNNTKSKIPVTTPSNLYMNDAPLLSSLPPSKITTNSHSPKQTSVSSSKTTVSKVNSNSTTLSLTIPLKPASRSRKKTPESEADTSPKKKRAPRKKAQSDSKTLNDVATTLLTTTRGPNNSVGVPHQTTPFPAPYVNNTKSEYNASDDVYNWPNAASTEQTDIQTNNKKKPCVKDDPARAFEELRENIWSHLSKCVLDQAQQFDIPSLIGTLYTLRSENEKLVSKVRDLTLKREQLMAMNAKLDLPGPMLTQHLNNTSPNFSSVVSGLINSPKGSPAPSPGNAMNKQSIISVVGSYNHVPPGSLGSHVFLDRSSPLVGQPHSGVNNIKSSQISTPSPPIGALMAHGTSNRSGLISVNPPYMSSGFPPMNTIGQLGTNSQSSPYYPRQ